MPKSYAPDASSWPDDVRLAVEVLSSPIRLEILRYLVEHPGLPLGPLYEGVGGLGKTSFIAHLRALEAAGVVKGDLEPELRRGRSPRYFALPDRVRELTRAWADYVTNGRS